MKPKWNQAFGFALIILASCFWGASASLGKTLMQNGLTTIMLMETRSVVTVLILFLLFLIAAPRHMRIEKRDLPAFVLLGIPGLALVNVSYYNAVRLLNVALAVFIQFTAPVLVFLYGWISKKEKAGPAKFMALLLCLIGTYLMVQLHKSHSEKPSLFGLACAFISMVSYAFYVILSHRLGQKHSSWTLVFYGYGIASIFWCVLQSTVETTHQLTAHHLWPKAILFSFTSTLIPFSIFLAGLRKVTPTGAAIASTSETVTATLFAFLLLGESLTLGQIIGAGFILTAILILVYKSESPPVLEEV